MDFDLDAIEAEMDKMTQEMTTEEIAAMEKEIAEGLGQSFDEIFGADQPRFSYIIQRLTANRRRPSKKLNDYNALAYPMCVRALPILSMITTGYRQK